MSEPGSTVIRTRPADLLKWIEAQPDLAHLRKAASESTCIYYPQTDEIVESPGGDYSGVVTRSDRSMRKRLLDTIGIVPPRSLRGLSYASKGLDAKLSNASAAISFCNLWDFISGLPVLNLMFIGLLGPASWGGALATSWIILVVDRESSKGAVNRSKANVKSANVWLSVFIALSLIRTFFAGVGFDLMIGKQGIAARYAEEVAKSQISKDKQEHSRLIKSQSPQLSNFSEKCKEYTEQLRSIGRDNPKFDSLYLLAYGSLQEGDINKSLSFQQLLAKYGGQVENVPGDCNKEKVQIGADYARAEQLGTQIDKKVSLLNSLPPLKYLQTAEPDLFNENFKVANPQSGEVEFRNGITAVGQATLQFYGDISRGKIADLGLSLMWMLFSVVLCYLAVQLLSTLSLQTETKASFDESLQNTRQKLLALYRRRLVDYQVQKGMLNYTDGEDI
jgi:hypothetical protein